VLALAPARALPGHGPEIARPSDLIRGYLVHRARREAQVLRALAGGAGTPEMLVPRIYERLPASLAAPAAESVRAHLDLLVEQGRVVEGKGVTGWREREWRRCERMEAVNHRSSSLPGWSSDGPPARALTNPVTPAHLPNHPSRGSAEVE
jgi:glyoxylase-like metal-dependent hydrolase (beta-lactamase superfamily II)